MKEYIGNILQEIDIEIDEIALYGYDIIETSLTNGLYLMEKETSRLCYSSVSTDQQTIDIYIIDSFGQMQQLSFSFNNESSNE